MRSTGSRSFGAASSAKYSRVDSPMLMPRATSQTLTCGAIGCPCRPATGPGFTVSKLYSPVAKSVPVRPQPRKPGSSAPSCRSAGWL